MTDTIIYTTPVCPFCVRAKKFLEKKGVTDYKEIDVSSDISIKNEMVEKSGGKQSVPQIFINNVHVGGFDDLVKLDQEGKLNSLINKG